MPQATPDREANQALITALDEEFCMLGVWAPEEALTWSESDIRKFYESGGCDMPTEPPPAPEAPSATSTPEAPASLGQSPESACVSSSTSQEFDDRKHLDNALRRVVKFCTTVKSKHCDLYGHVNNASYLTLFEEARWDLVAANGYTLETVKETGKGPVILEANIKYLKEVRDGAQVEISPLPPKENLIRIFL